MIRRALRVGLLLLAAASCRAAPPGGPAAQLAQRVGWIATGCFAIENRSLAEGTPVAVVTLGDDQKVLAARVAGQSAGGTPCPVRPAAAEIDANLAFYPLSPAVDAGIGVVGAAPRAGSSLDLDGDGRGDRFISCAGSEGISYTVWSGEPWVGEPLWSGYEYLGFDSESDCPPG